MCTQTMDLLIAQRYRLQIDRWRISYILNNNAAITDHCSTPNIIGRIPE